MIDENKYNEYWWNIEKNPLYFIDVPEEFKTEEMCLYTLSLLVVLFVVIDTPKELRKGYITRIVETIPKSVPENKITEHLNKVLLENKVEI